MYVRNIIIAMFVAAFPITSGCPLRCRCDTVLQTVYCMGKGFVNLPNGIPRDTKTLNLRNNRIVSGPYLDKILRTLPDLRKLDLSHNSLTSFPEHLPPSLTWISLKGNDMRYVGSRALGQLSLLGALNLDNNRISNKCLSPSAFSGTANMHTLHLRWNRLTSLPQGLPRNLSNAFFGHNLIGVVSQSAVRSLRNLKTLELSYNNLTSETFDMNTLLPLISLQELGLSHNQLTYIPKIKSVNEPVKSQPRSMSLSRLIYLKYLDLSFNRLRWVEPGSLDRLESLTMVNLHHNPWHCDFHWTYFKTWISTTPAYIVLTSKTVCLTPEAIQNVTLPCLDCISLASSTRPVPDYNISTTPQSIALQWDISNLEYPNYVEFSAFCGVPRCDKCIYEKIIEKYTYVSSIVKSHSIYPSDYSDPGDGFARIEITNRAPGTLYIVCMTDSSEDFAYVTTDDCKYVETNSQSVRQILENKLNVPLWLVILIAILLSLALVVFVIATSCQLKAQL